MSQALSWTEVAYVHTVTHHVLILNRDIPMVILVSLSSSVPIPGVAIGKT